MASRERRTIIADVKRVRLSQLPGAVFVAALLVGALAAWHIHRLGLTLAHHDARAHLVVARRITDNITPGWQQVGALWLPLPHLLNLIPIQWDWNYRTGFSATLISIVTLAWGLAALARYLLRRTGSAVAAVMGPALVLCNPNVLYLQGTPMTEPIFFGFALAALDAVDAWHGETPPSTAAVSWLLALLMLVRYEAWPVAAALLGLLTFTTVSRRSLLHLSAGPVLAALGFLALSKASVGSWFVSSGFFVVDNAAHGKFLVALAQTCRGLLSVSDAAVLLAAMAGLAWCLRMAVRERSSRALLPVALLATALVPLAAFHAGHPFRVRYVVQLTVAAAVLAAFALSWLPARLRGPAAAALISVSFWLNPPFVASSPIVNEAQVDGPLARERASVSAVLAARTDRSPIMASMQSLAHYMQETSRIGLNVADYLHEGNGDLWTAALAEPRRYVRWMLIEERAEGGDLLAERARTHPGFLDGFARVAGGGGLVLYRRDDSR